MSPNCEIKQAENIPLRAMLLPCHVGSCTVHFSEFASNFAAKRKSLQHSAVAFAIHSNSLVLFQGNEA
jgi:hypothetical protein